MNSCAPILSVSSLSAGYDGQQVIRGIDITLQKGEICAIIGPNGSGKSTLLKAIMGLAEITHGNVTINSVRNNAAPPFVIARRGVGYFPQGAPVFGEMTVRQNILLGWAGPRQSAPLDEVFSLFPSLAQRSKVPAGQLSGGERQMLAFARLMIWNPSLLLLDEPTSGLHPRVRQAMLGKVCEWCASRDMACLLVEQNVGDVAAISTRMYGMKKGQIVCQGDGRMLRESIAMKDISCT